MKVVIAPNALDEMKDFYRAALESHLSLDEETVKKKVRRFMSALRQLEFFPLRYPKVRYKPEWIEQGCRDFVFENLHAAYKIVLDEQGEQYVLVVGVCHSKLYHD